MCTLYMNDFMWEGPVSDSNRYSGAVYDFLEHNSCSALTGCLPIGVGVAITIGYTACAVLTC